MIEVFDRGLKRLAVLEKAYDRVEAHALNGVGELTFSLPGDDAKGTLCAPFSFVRAPGGDFYRLLADGREDGALGEVRFEAEHAIATLVDDLMFGTHMIGGKGVHTRQVLAYILSRQTVRHWRLGDCEIDKEFEYGFESENLLNALFAVPNLFVEDYRFEYDMRSYPWTLSLRRLETRGKPQFYVRAGRNLIASRAYRTGASVCTRLYLKGYGEGDNQLTIAEVNGGKPYLESPPEVIAKYGLISKNCTLREFEDARSLMERGRALLKGLQEPQYTRQFKVADLHALTGDRLDEARVGDRVRLTMDGADTYITGVRRHLDADGEMALEMSTQARSIAADVADIADRQRIEQVYAQGATQVFSKGLQANATAGVPAVMAFFIPEEMRIVNKVLVKISLEPFRSYSQVTSGGGRSTQTSSAGGGSASTSAYGGATTVTTTSDGETTVSAAQTVTLDSGVGFTTDASSVTVSGEAHPSYSRVTGGASGQTGSASSSSTGSATGGATGSAGGGQTGGSREYTGNAGGDSHSHYMYHTHAQGAHTHSTPAHAHSFAHTHPPG